MDIVFLSIAILGGIGVLSAIILFITAKKFSVKEDPKVAEIEDLLPGANCGGCGKNGCHDFALACSRAKTLDGLRCPSCSDEVMSRIACIVGLAQSAPAVKKVAVLHCNGTCENRPKKSIYDGPASCHILNSLYIGSSGCAYGCLGCGDCVSACKFGAMKLNKVTGLVEIDDKKLKRAGATLVGKTVLDELAMGGTGTTGATGVVKNPWDKERMCAGSSAGSACAVAAGVYPYATASDTGDSIRKPAAFGGVVGFKPTYGRISRYGLFAFASSLDHVGCFARTVEDCAIVTDIIKGKDFTLVRKIFELYKNLIFFVQELMQNAYSQITWEFRSARPT